MFTNFDRDSVADANTGDTGFSNRTSTDDRVGYLKVLVMSVLREIDAIERAPAGEPDGGGNLLSEVQRFESELIRNALVRTGGRQRRAARLLGVKVTTLNTKIRRYRIQVSPGAARTESGNLSRSSQIEMLKGLAK